MFSGSGMELKIRFPKILKKSSEMDSKFPWLATQLSCIASEPLHILPLPFLDPLANSSIHLAQPWGLMSRQQCACHPKLF